jgi:23S rRNA pseudouridine1911/1915/1917 synthase
MKMKNNLNILYEDNHVIVVVKPSNILSQGDATGDKNMLDMVKEYIKVKYNKPGNVYVGLVHRLDRPVGGVMVFAKSSKAASRLSESIKKHEGFNKKYLAVVRGNPPKEGTFKDYLLKKEDGNTIISDKKHGKESILNYRVLETKDNLSLVEVELITGRHHQIRVQFASRGFSLYGDARYGINTGDDICLWAYKLSFVHPTLKEEKEFVFLPNNDKNGWNSFDLKSVKIN